MAMRRPRLIEVPSLTTTMAAYFRVFSETAYRYYMIGRRCVEYICARLRTTNGEWDYVTILDGSVTSKTATTR